MKAHSANLFWLAERNIIGILYWLIQLTSRQILRYLQNTGNNVRNWLTLAMTDATVSILCWFNSYNHLTSTVVPLFVRHIGHRSTVRLGSCPRSQSFKVSETESDSLIFLQSTDYPQQTIIFLLLIPLCRQSLRRGTKIVLHPSLGNSLLVCWCTTDLLFTSSEILGTWIPLPEPFLQ